MDPNRANQLNLAYSQYECPVCFDFAGPPIHLCLNGHLVCSKCIPQLDCCPTCKGNFGASRCIPMEKMLDSILFPCKYSSAGCQVTLLLKEMGAHEENCSFFLKFPCIICSWKGAVEKVVAHMQQEHLVKKPQGNHVTYFDKNGHLHSPDAWTRCALSSCFGHHFAFLYKKEKKTNDQLFDFFIIAVLLTGSPDEASKFTYKIKIQGDKNKLTWKSTPLSALDFQGPSSIINCGYRVFDSTTCHFFSVDDKIKFDYVILQSP